MKDRFDAAGVGIAAISADESADSAAYVAEEGVAIPLLADPELRVISAYGVAMDGNDIAVPATFIVRQDRTIAWRHIGETMADRPDAEGLLALALEAR